MPPEGRRVGGFVGEIEASGCVVLAYRGCGERLTLLGRRYDWYGEGRTGRRCAGCGGEVRLGDRAGEVARAESVEAPPRTPRLGGGAVSPSLLAILVVLAAVAVDAAAYLLVTHLF